MTVNRTETILGTIRQIGTLIRRGIVRVVSDSISEKLLSAADAFVRLEYPGPEAQAKISYSSV